MTRTIRASIATLSCLTMMLTSTMWSAAGAAHTRGITEPVTFRRRVYEVGPSVQQAVAAPRGRSFDRTIEMYGEVAADRRSRVVATVTAAVPLTEAQRDRLAAALHQLYGHEVHLNIEIDPELIGGVRVELGDEVIDASILSRLEEARRRLTR